MRGIVENLRNHKFPAPPPPLQSRPRPTIPPQVSLLLVGPDIRLPAYPVKPISNGLGTMKVNRISGNLVFQIRHFKQTRILSDILLIKKYYILDFFFINLNFSNKGLK